jgi:hypothetical protein
MVIRRPTPEDLPKILEIAQGYNYPLPKKFLTASIVEKDNEVVAFGVTEGIIEVSFYCTGSARTKVESIKQLLQVAKEDVKAHGYTQLYGFVLDPKFSEAAIKHLGFHKVPGIPVYLNLE